MAGLRRILIVLVVLFLIVVALVFSMNNQTSVSLDFLLFKTPSHGVAVWVLLAFILGTVTGILVTMLATAKHSIARRQLKKRLTRAEQALEDSKAQNSRTL
ncbi:MULTISPECIES: LapA family protein [Marinobacter]|uniref:LapA family protein n=1 Tax=Marinobacter xestospongiae TaxID=994319 RepID=A0ABU3VZV6_9GAMM|nr:MULTISPECIES: LapA family protein [Marinobacter]MCG8519700.1 LapA family protein [Pseudomonadales bacterium]MCK7565819.1 LapA family protein [Marinobacter xestospongiae]MDV2079266.1 LapA family protein [Marinobacter xestospongiae]UDL03542.1 LapA family protein [Marinobacter sp. CA1]